VFLDAALKDCRPRAAHVFAGELTLASIEGSGLPERYVANAVNIIIIKC
jgi:hypothetical protein